MTLNHEDIVLRLRLAGIGVDETRLQVENRKGRILVRLDEDKISWFPEQQEDRVALENERRIVRLVEKYCGFGAPRILYEDAEGWDVRAIVPGVAAVDFLTQVRTDPRGAERMGAALGRILAEQHLYIPASELEWLARVRGPHSAAIANLPKVIEDSWLLARIGRALEHWEEVAVHVSDPVLVHGDLGAGNLAVSAVTGEVQGVFDYGDAAFGDRHRDDLSNVWGGRRVTPRSVEPNLLGSPIDRRLNYAKFSKGFRRNVVCLNDPLDIIVSQADQLPLNYERLDIGCKAGKESIALI
jgi:aminoglycoside phosphotransferase